MILPSIHPYIHKQNKGANTRWKNEVGPTGSPWLVGSPQPEGRGGRRRRSGELGDGDGCRRGEMVTAVLAKCLKPDCAPASSGFVDPRGLRFPWATPPAPDSWAVGARRDGGGGQWTAWSDAVIPVPSKICWPWWACLSSSNLGHRGFRSSSFQYLYFPSESQCDHC
jgi:hypothetical protein